MYGPAITRWSVSAGALAANSQPVRTADITMPDPRIILLLAALYGAFYLTDHYVVQPTIKVVHVVKATGKKVGHALAKVVGK